MLSFMKTIDDDFDGINNVIKIDMVRGDCNQDTLLIEGKGKLCAGKINVI